MVQDKLIHWSRKDKITLYLFFSHVYRVGMKWLLCQLSAWVKFGCDMHNALCSLITQNRCWARLPIYSVPSWWLSSGFWLNIRTTREILVDCKTGCFKSSLIVICSVSRSIEECCHTQQGQTILPNRASLPLHCCFRVHRTRKMFHVASSALSINQPSAFPMLQPLHITWSKI